MQPINQASDLRASNADGVLSVTPPSPVPEYSQRLIARESEARRLNRRHIWTGNLRLVVFAGIAVLCWYTRKAARPSVYGLIGAVVLFIGLGLWDRRTVQARDRAKRAANFYRHGIARIEDRWLGSGEAGEEFQARDHLYAEDLSIFGTGGLFQLLCAARTVMGKSRLAAWLLSPAEPEEIKSRQMAVREIATRLDLREDLAVAGESEQIKADPETLLHWAGEDSEFDYRRWWIWTLILAALSFPTLAYGFLRGFWTPFLLVMIANANITFWLRHRLNRMFAGLDEASRNLDALVCVLRRIEGESFETKRNRNLQSALLTAGLKASDCIARLAKLSQLADSRDNLFVKALDVPLLYSVQLAFALQRWKDRFASGVAAWIDSIGQIEALASLAAFAHEHPEDPFPEIDLADAPCFHGSGLGHPLLPAAICVRNSVVLRGRGQVLLVSGSNMSGKSTLLRMVGVNAVLAMCGAPVRARSLRLSPLVLGSAINVSDSLQKGVSHFYAEIKRIGQVVALSRAKPALFLFDEILQGTNSRDRRVGAEGIVHELIANGAIGLVTTHDLALTELAEAFPDHIRNVHFQEAFESGKLHFDYRLQEGVVTTSNGVELMRSIGLKV